jgi:hypothetical protein
MGLPLLPKTRLHLSWPTVTPYQAKGFINGRHR